MDLLSSNINSDKPSAKPKPIKLRIVKKGKKYQIVKNGKIDKNKVEKEDQQNKNLENDDTVPNQTQEVKNKQNSINVSPLLLAYTYQINNECSKLVSVGFETGSFQPAILFQNVNKSFLQLNVFEYINIFLYANEIQSFFNETNSLNVNNHYITIKSVIVKKVKHLIIKKKFNEKNSSNQKIILKSEEWDILLRLFNFFDVLIFWYRSTAQNVFQYYKHYLQLCCEKNLRQLTTEYFFTPNESNNVQPISHLYGSTVMFNYSRLFHEIPIICFNRLTQDIFNNLCNTMY